MRRIINGKVYDTKKARKIVGVVRDGADRAYILYRTPQGNYFLYRWNSWHDEGWSIKPLSREEAVHFLIDHDLFRVLESEFPDVVASMVASIEK